MNKIILTITSLCFSLSVLSQDQGIHFTQGLSWKEIEATAKKENKFIFVDCYTTWCGPCRFMARNIFPLKETGDAVNGKFISVGIQLDSTTHDSDTIKRGYSDTHQIMTQYGIRAFPTYLFFNPDGKLVHRAVGSTTDAAQFITFFNDALNPERQYYGMMDRYRTGSKDTVMLESLAGYVLQNGNNLLADSVLKDLLLLIKNPFTKERLELLGQTIQKTEDPGFNLFFNQAQRIDQIEKPDFAESIVMNAIIRGNAMIMALFEGHSIPADWDQISEDIKHKYGSEYAQRIIVWIKVPYYKKDKQWDLYGKSLVFYIKEYGNHLQAGELNNYAWDIFLYCNNQDDLTFGLSCSSRAIAGSEKPDPTFMDTYANLLYKLGRVSEAITKETEALDLAGSSDKKTYQDTLDKMKSGAKTWD